MLERALELLQGGLSILPVKADGTKAPAIRTFDQFKTERRATEQEVREWYADGEEKGVGVLCGRLSGNLVVLDFETKAVFAAWAELTEGEIEDWGELPCVNSPRGVHIYARLPEPIPGRRLATEFIEEEDKDTGKKVQKRQTLIEFRGDGQYVVGPGSPGGCHPSGIGWVLRGGVDVFETPEISMRDWNVLCRVAMSFNQAPESAHIVTGMAKISKDDVRPGTDYCYRSGLSDWRELLERHGWECIREDRNGRQIWKRPGKEEPGGSATLGFCTTDLGLVLYVFSTNADPFREDRAYNIFSARALLEFDGNYSDTSRALQKEGYGEAAREEIRNEVKAQIDKLKTLKGEDALGMQDQIDNWCAASRKFKELWERKRKDIGEDIHRYEICLLLFAYQKLGTPDESGIVKGLRIVRLWREKYDEDPDQIFDADYASRKIEWILNRPDRKDEGDILREHEAEKAGKTPDSRFAWLSMRLGFPVKRFVQVGPNRKEATYYFVTEHRRWIHLGTIDDVEDVKRCQGAVRADVDEDGDGVPGFSGAFREEVRTRVSWEGILAVLFDCRKETRIREVEDASGRKHSVLGWVEEYCESKGAYGQTEEDQVKAAIRGHRPYLEDASVCVQLEQFQEFVRNARGQRFTDISMRDLFRAAGMKKFKKNIRVDGKQVSRHYWRIPLSRLPSNSGNGTEPESAR